MLVWISSSTYPTTKDFVQTFFSEKVWIQNTLPTYGLDICPKFRSFFIWDSLLSLMSDYALGFRTSYLIIVPIEFWRNSDLFKKKEHFSSSKIDKMRTFRKKISEIVRKSLKSYVKVFETVLVHNRSL